MKRHLNTLYVTHEGAYLHKQGETVCVEVDREIKLRVPFINLEGIVCFGLCAVSPPLLGACADAGISVSFLNSFGKFLATVQGFTSGNVVLRRTQYRLADDAESSLAISKNIVLAKVANSRAVVLRSAREAKESANRELLSATAKLLLPSLAKIRVCGDRDALRGIEGFCAKIYFEAFSTMLKHDAGFRMNGRTRRPPLDSVNALLSFLYSILAHDVRSACQATGLDAAVGFFHTDRPGRPGLALDLMEELRAYVADRLVASLINRGQIKCGDFQCSEGGGYALTDDARKIVLVAYQKRKEDEIVHPFLKEKITIGILPHIQARLLARHLRSDLDEYPAFIWK